MIRYQLQCPHEHRFEAWFSSSAAFDEQAGGGQIDCPVCGATKITKALMAPNISPKTRARGKRGTTPGSGGKLNDQTAAEPGIEAMPEAAAPGEPDAQSPGSVAAGPDNLFATQGEFVDLMRRIRKEVESKADYVGPRFAEEARKIHHEESEPRGIYGEATPEEVEELNDEGVDFYPLPRLPEDNN